MNDETGQEIARAGFLYFQNSEGETFAVAVNDLPEFTNTVTPTFGEMEIS